jgi:hypothetical protein
MSDSNVSSAASGVKPGRGNKNTAINGSKTATAPAKPQRRAAITTLKDGTPFKQARTNAKARLAVAKGELKIAEKTEKAARKKAAGLTTQRTKLSTANDKAAADFKSVPGNKDLKAAAKNAEKALTAHDKLIKAADKEVQAAIKAREKAQIQISNAEAAAKKLEDDINVRKNSLS